MQPIGDRTGTFADRRLYTTMAGDLVEEGNPEAAFLAYPRGGEVAPSHLKAYKRIVGGQSAKDDLPDEPRVARKRVPARKRAVKSVNKMAAKPADK